MSEQVAARRLSTLGGAQPRVVVSGNFATPWELVRILERSLQRFRIFVLNPQGE